MEERRREDGKARDRAEDVTDFGNTVTDTEVTSVAKLEEKRSRGAAWSQEWSVGRNGRGNGKEARGEQGKKN